MAPCKFDRAWIGACHQPSKDGLCEEHKGKKCISCGRQAVRECPSSSSLVCGAPLCEKCGHEPYKREGFLYGKDNKHGQYRKL